MSETKNTDSTQEKIIRAGEELFAAHGFGRVTLRQIAREAGQRNVSAVQYHFKSKQGLLIAIAKGHRDGIDARRAELLDKATTEGTDEDLSTLLSILVVPLAAKLDSASGRAYLQIQAQGLTNLEMRPATRDLVDRITRYSRTLTSASDAPYQSRFALLLLFHALADRANLESNGKRHPGDRGEFVAALSHSLRGLLST
jgi:AcrR family transcriptional regulator